MERMPMSIETNRALVLKFYELMSRLEFDRMFELMSDDATWTVAGRPETFHHAGVSSKVQRAKGFAEFVKGFVSLEQRILSTTAEGDRVAVEARSRCETRQGLVYENELLVLLRCRDGKIVSIYEHLDQQSTLEFERKLRAALGASSAH
jgi:ketosteroid isomerase-like protein